MTKPNDIEPTKTGAAAAASQTVRVTPPVTQIDKKLIRQLATMLDETGLTEIEYEMGGLRVRVAKNARDVGGAATAAGAPATDAAQAGLEQPAAMDPASHPGVVKAPMVGVAYLLPEPGAAPFIKVGDAVAEGQTVALIEAMKTFNPVKAPNAGKITRILFENGSPVEYGEPLVIIE